MLDQRDLDQLSRYGIDRGEAERQLDLFDSPPPPIVLDRPATIGDGITLLDEEGESHRSNLADLSMSRVSRFVPASGAATRMFRDLLAALDAEPGDSDSAGTLRRFESASERFPFQDALTASRAGSQDQREQLRELLGGSGGLADLPKGLIPFHRYVEPETCELTAFEEQIREAAALSDEWPSKLRLHFTVGPEHRARFEALLEARRSALETDLGVELDVGFSEQSAATNTLAVDMDGQPVRDEQGQLALRPGGHGSLLVNLGATAGDIVIIKNIDNVLTRQHRSLVGTWKRQLLGHLVDLERRLDAALERLPEDSSEALAVASELGVDVDDVDLASNRDELRHRLSRPLRVCGVVANEGEPGGGPFWVKGNDGRVSLQIVESAQINSDDPQQTEIAAKATHFNPVDLVCSLRDADGEPHDLSRFVDPATCFLTEKSSGGKSLRALEHPGLWNGSMAHWITVFVEVPAATFKPVKTVWDLLRDEHQGS